MPRGREPLAIVGIGCRLPGDVNSPDDYWALLLGGIDATRSVPETRWNAARFYDPKPTKAGKMVTRRGGYLEDIDKFDAQFFGVSPREANLLDPQQRLLLHSTWEALEDAGIPPEGLAGSATGVFIGGFTLDYQLLQNQGRTSRFRFKTHSATGMMMTMLANRISYAYDFRGPSMSIDTACSSSLVAVHLAAQSIWNGECDLALAGGVNIIVGPNTAIAESKSGFLSPDGRCKAFAESADGYARGEGGAIVVVKPLARALDDGDRIYAQILGSAVTQDGRTDSITVPSEDAQRSAITTALRHAGVDARDIGYVEAHGTGTPVGDPVEMRALATALAADRPATDPLLIGSVKTNIGHLEAGAGVAGLIKAALVLTHGYIPANLHFDEPSSRIPFAELNIEVPRTGRPFPACERRMAGVNSFGFGGTNAHVVLAEAPTAAENPCRTPSALTLLPISARSEDALAALAGRLAEHLRITTDVTLPDLGYTLGQRRSHLSLRRTLVTESVSDATKQLDAIAADSGQASTGRTSNTESKLAFVCTGMGPQWWKMCRGLLDEFPVFTDSIRRSDRELSRYTEWSLLDELRRNEADSRMASTAIAQPANFAIQVALAAQLEHMGITPDAVIGHSAGEVAAHHLAGLLSFEQAIQVIYHRSRLQQRTSGRGRMLAVGLSAEKLMQTIDSEGLAEFGVRVSIAAINSPFAVTIAGDGDALDGIVRQLDAADVFTRYLPVTVPYHTHYMDAIKDDLHQALDGLASNEATTALYSTVTGELLTSYAAGAAYWWQNTRATVLFEPALRRLLDDGYTDFVELGPHPVLASSIVEIAGARAVSVMASQRRTEDDARSMLNCVGALHNRGYRVAWDVVNPREGAQLLTLPAYPWQAKRFWNEPPEAGEDLHYHPVHPLLGQPVSGVHPTWEVELNTTAFGFLADHQVQGTVVVPGAVFIEMAMAAARETYGTSHSVDDVVLHRALILDDRCDPLVRTTLDKDGGTVEFAAFTATADGDFTWTVTATAELNTISPVPRPALAEQASGTSMDGAAFYAATTAIGFDYGDAFQAIVGITADTGWASADITIPLAIADDLGDYQFHPALVDAAFQTLFGTMLVDRDTSDVTYLPTRIRHCAIHGTPQDAMTVQVRVVSATSEEIESDIRIVDGRGETLAVFDGFTVQSLSASSAMSTERIDKGLYEMQWVAKPDVAERRSDAIDQPGQPAWLVFTDSTGVGTLVADRLRTLGHRVDEVTPDAVDSLVPTAAGYTINPAAPEHIRDLLDTYLHRAGDLTGIIDCWPLDIPACPEGQPTSKESVESVCRIGVFTILRLVKALAEIDTVTPRLHLVTANAQPALGSDVRSVDQAAIWGLGRVIGHQEFAKHWGGLIDIEDHGDCADAAERICRHVLDGDVEDQVAFRGNETLVPRLRPAAHLTTPFPTKLAANATYVVTGGAGALGRTVATFLADRGARHVVLLSRRAVPPRRDWPHLDEQDPHFGTVETIERIERLGVEITCASVDVTDPDQVHGWLDEYVRGGGRPVRGIVHTAGSVDDRLLVNMTEDDFRTVLSPKITGTRVLHEVFGHSDLDFFVMFGSAGSVIASPGQGNYAAANAFLDAFAHLRHAQGLPALTIGWGPWSVGMVEELKLERIYAQRGIELITPAAGTRILDRLINQTTPAVVAITADWGRAQRVGLVGQLPPMFSDLQTSEPSTAEANSGVSILETLVGTPEPERLAVITDHVRRSVAAIFDCALDDIEPDDILDDLGLDSLMAMEFRVRINAMFAIDLPVLEILKGVSVTSLAVRILTELDLVTAEAPPSPGQPVDAVGLLVDQLSDDDLRTLLAELEAGEP